MTFAYTNAYNCALGEFTVGRIPAILANLEEPPPRCGHPLDCGGECYLEPKHDGEHMCVGDFEGEPGSCPA